MNKKSKKIIQTIEDLARHYGKLLATYWMPWIPTAGLILIIAAYVPATAGEIGEINPGYTIGWEHVLMLPALIIFPWIAGLLIGEIPKKKKDNNAANK